jgi:cholesterol transport system auxiliary component
MENRSTASFPAALLDRRLFLLGASALVLSACSNVIGPPDAPQIYVLKPVVPAAAPGAPIAWALAIDIPTCSEALDSSRIALTHSDTTLEYYTNAVWPDTLPMTVQTAMLAAFQDGGRIGAVARGQDDLHADYTLALDIRDFAAHYSDADGAPKVTVTIVAQMATAHGRKVVANLMATQSAQASINSVDAVVQAMDQALSAVISQITGWVLALPPPPGP